MHTHTSADTQLKHPPPQLLSLHRCCLLSCSDVCCLLPPQTVDLDALLCILVQVARGMAYLHSRGLLHGGEWAHYSLPMQSHARGLANTNKSAPRLTRQHIDACMPLCVHVRLYVVQISRVRTSCYSESVPLQPWHWVCLSRAVPLCQAQAL